MFEVLKNLFSKKDATPLKQLLEAGAFLVDVRSPIEFSSGHVKGSVNIPVDQIQNQLKQFIGKKNIVVFCKSGMRSSQAKAILKKNGIEDVTNGGTWGTINQLINTK